MKRYRRTNVFAVFCALTSVFLSLYGCGGGGGGGGDGVVPPAPPAAPASVTADAGNGQVTISWAPVAGATSCNVYQTTTAGDPRTTGTKVGTNITTRTFTVKGLANGTTYYFMVTAVNSAGESGGSVVQSATPIATTLPLQTIAVTSDKVAVEWGINPQFIATGSYSDGSTKNLTATVLWSSTNPPVATVDATGIAFKYRLGPKTAPIVNTAILGALAR